MKKLFTILLITLIFLTFAACDLNSSDYTHVQHSGRTEEIRAYKQIGEVTIIVTDSGVYVTTRTQEVEG